MEMSLWPDEDQTRPLASAFLDPAAKRKVMTSPRAHRTGPGAGRLLGGGHPAAPPPLPHTPATLMKAAFCQQGLSRDPSVHPEQLPHVWTQSRQPPGWWWWWECPAVMEFCSAVRICGRTGSQNISRATGGAPAWSPEARWRLTMDH